MIRVERAGELWTALVETKTNGNALKTEQVQAYADIDGVPPAANRAWREFGQPVRTGPGLIISIL